jgi:hypothetical protein
LNWINPPFTNPEKNIPANYLAMINATVDLVVQLPGFFMVHFACIEKTV